MTALNSYRFVTVFRFRAPVEAVWAALQRFDQYVRWTRGIVEVRELEPGGERQVGSVVRVRVRSTVPYTLVFDATVTRIEPPHLLELRADGDLVGIGRWTLEQSGIITSAAYRWEVATRRRWMNLLAPVARSLFAWNHDRMMAALGRGMAEALGSPLTISRESPPD